MSTEKELARFQKNPREWVIIRLNEFKGKEYFDIRIHVPKFSSDGSSPEVPQEGNPELIPTKKGVSVSVDLLPQMRAAVEAACQEKGIPPV